MTALKNLSDYDLSCMKLLWEGKNNLVGFSIDDIFSVMAPHYQVDERSPLEAKLDKLINSYWTNSGSKELRAMLAAQKLNPRTKDIFRSKNTPHTFPWYHRNRKY